MRAITKLGVSIGSVMAVMVIGTAGYVLIEDQPILDSAYMTVITVFTVGYAEAVPLHQSGRVWTMFVIIFGYGMVAVSLANLVSIFVGGEFLAISGRLRMKKQINQLKQHVIICGFGRMGVQVAAELKREGTDVVIVEKDAGSEFESRGLLYVSGDATEEEVLLEAGLMQARALVACLGTDSDNVYVTLTARGLCPSLKIISRADQLSTEMKLRRAGADSVVCPQIIGANKAAALLLRPHVVDFVDMAARGVDVEVAQYEVTADSSLPGKQLRDSQIRERADVMVVAIRRSDGSQIFSPGPAEIIHEKDQLVLVGRSGLTERLDVLRE